MSAWESCTYSRDRAWADAENEFRRAIELNPNLSKPRQDFAVWVLFPLGKVDEALNQLHAARGTRIGSFIASRRKFFEFSSDEYRPV